MPKIQETHKNPRQNVITIPQQVMENMKWEKGDFLVVYCDKDNDSVTMKRVQDGSN